MYPQLSPQQGYINLLILSESGCGKSTFINALFNYLTFLSLDDAIKRDGPVYKIPLAFTKGKQGDRVIRIGNVPDGKILTNSDTQTTNCYEMEYNKKIIIRIFDTPGIADTEGIEKDQLNFKDIMCFINQYEHLNAILIMMNPNSSRLNIAVHYYINEMLKHLHRDATKNIIFCFTHSIGTDFEGGDSIPVLNRLIDEIKVEHGVSIELSERTTYYFDNKCFRHLCEVKDAKNTGIQPSKMAYMSSKLSWDLSVGEMHRMFEHILKLCPHQISKTVSLNEARTIIILLSKPLADITENIQANIALATRDRDRIRGLDAENANLDKDLRTQQEYPERKNIDYPRTVCSYCSTTERGKNGESMEVFDHICHDHCYLEKVKREVKGAAGLQQCRAMEEMDGEIRCTQCPSKCLWEKHMHIWYVLYKETRTVENATVAKMIGENRNKQSIIQQAIADLDLRVKKLQAEQASINDIAARFGTYLKHNGIVAHNKFIEEYVNMQIDVADRVKDELKVKGLRKMLAAYNEQRRIIEQYLDTGKETILPENIEQYLQKLFALEENGKKIEELYCAEKWSADKQQASDSDTARQQQVPSTSLSTAGQGIGGIVKKMKKMMH